MHFAYRQIVSSDSNIMIVSIVGRDPAPGLDPLHIRGILPAKKRERKHPCLAPGKPP